MMGYFRFVRFAFIQQLLRFGMIGITATLVNFLVVVLLVELVKLHPLSANVFAFMTAFSVSYLGHQYWTFHDYEVNHKKAFRRFFTLSILSFAANEGLFFILLNTFHVYYTIALCLVLLVVPPVTFILNRCWVFR